MELSSLSPLLVAGLVPGCFYATPQCHVFSLPTPARDRNTPIAVAFYGIAGPGGEASTERWNLGVETCPGAER
jgi:hypothetical protein